MLRTCSWLPCPLWNRTRGSRAAKSILGVADVQKENIRGDDERVAGRRATPVPAGSGTEVCGSGWCMFL